ncbi:NAD(P)H-dependent oxidoreductase [filamentous cyanobacterium LEGE 11480]|uniref:NAD(P)H-dependent oxidoreductase n=1 Tax=Romeriopsis navalis LEGE 11480 TaxID=2777977 RepID=A0A928VLF1_9CYAN|nr:NAD(P)H-dependent oxidoreductase [Romeriopsis navalis]MBE9028169.1 NAD(P)H-dependent oxidoreductase [Romeriopsis navalis LEGE 11480]
MSQAATPESALQQLQWRYATKVFDSSKKIPDDAWKVLEQSLVLSPSSFGLQPWKFFVIENADIRQELLGHSWKQAQVVDASHLVVFAIKKDLNAADVDRYINRMASVQGVPAENLAGFGGMIKGFMEKPPYPLDMDGWSTRQVYIALGQFMTTAAMMGIDTSPLEGFSPSKYDEVLKLGEQGYSSVVVCGAGYRSTDDKYGEKPKVRYPTEEVVEYIG